MFEPVSKITNGEALLVLFGWACFWVGMVIALGPAGIFLGIGIPLLAMLSLDRLRVVVYTSKDKP